jgi:hypothetical protein
MNFLTEDQENELRECPLDFIDNEVIPDMVTPLADREDIEELNNTLFNSGILLLPDNEEAINEILEVIERHQGASLQICGRKRPS